MSQILFALTQLHPRLQALIESVKRLGGTVTITTFKSEAQLREFLQGGITHVFADFEHLRMLEGMQAEFPACKFYLACDGNYWLVK